MARCLFLGALLIALTLIYSQIAYANPVKEYGTMCTLYVNNIKVPTDILRADECRDIMETLGKRDQTHAKLKCVCLDGGRI